MPAYVFNPIGKTVQQAVPGLPAYLLGSLNRLAAPTRMNITNVQIAANVATLTVQVIEGNLPVANQVVWVSGCSNATFNSSATSTGYVITGASFTNVPENGIGTITFALVNAPITSVAATGSAQAPQVEVGETIAAESSVGIALQANTGPENGRSILFEVTFPTLPTAVTVSVQGADIDLDSEYVGFGTIATVSGSVQSGQALYFESVRYNFVRFSVTSLTGSGTICAKVTV